MTRQAQWIIVLMAGLLAMLGTLTPVVVLLPEARCSHGTACDLMFRNLLLMFPFGVFGGLLVGLSPRAWLLGWLAFILGWWGRLMMTMFLAEPSLDSESVIVFALLFGTMAVIGSVFAYVTLGLGYVAGALVRRLLMAARSTRT